MLEAAGMPDLGADATGLVISIILVLVLSGMFAVKDYFNRG